MELSQIIEIAASAVAFIAVIVVFVIMLVKYIKKYNSATTESEKQAALNDMMTEAMSLISNAEETYDELVASISGSSTTKASTGKMKKKDVCSQLLQYALSKGYDYDNEYWEEMVDEIVALTKKVNAETDETATESTTETATATTTTTTATR